MDHVRINRDHWNAEAPNWVRSGEHAWSGEPQWGNWQVPEAELELLPTDMTGMDAIELGCGTGYVSGWMVRRGARVTALDVSDAQLATARRLAAAHGAEITFIEGNAEAIDLPEAGFDFAISEYGAAIWCEPQIWLREAWRLLRPGGRLVFLGNHPFADVCVPLSGAENDYQLHRPYRGMRGNDYTKVEIEPGGVCFNLTIADWMALFAEIGFLVERYHELYAQDAFEETRFMIPGKWARDYPSEQVWALAKPA